MIAFYEERVYLDFIAALKNKFDFTEKRTLDEFIGMKIKFERGKSLFVSQEAILHSLLLKLKVPAKASSRTPGCDPWIYSYKK